MNLAFFHTYFRFIKFYVRKPCFLSVCHVRYSRYYSVLYLFQGSSSHKKNNREINSRINLLLHFFFNLFKIEGVKILFYYEGDSKFRRYWKHQQFKQNYLLKNINESLKLKAYANRSYFCNNLRFKIWKIFLVPQMIWGFKRRLSSRKIGILLKLCILVNSCEYFILRFFL